VLLLLLLHAARILVNPFGLVAGIDPRSNRIQQYFTATVGLIASDICGVLDLKVFDGIVT